MKTFTGKLGTRFSKLGSIIPALMPLEARATTQLELRQYAKVQVNWSGTCFDRAISALGLCNESQGRDALIHALLMFAARSSDRDDRHINPFDEAIYRLEQARINPNALVILRQTFNAPSMAFDRSVARTV